MYIKILSLEEKELYFLYKGVNILKNKDLLNKIKKNNRNNIVITVFKKNKKINVKDKGNIICPECKNLAILNINEDNTIRIDNCICEHKNEYSINEFIKNQYFNDNEIKCDICTNNKSLYDNNFYICTCRKYICSLCKIKHINNKGHNFLIFDKRYSSCNKHLLEFVSYCSQCKINLCINCEKEHFKHQNKIVLFKKENIDDKKKRNRK